MRILLAMYLAVAVLMTSITLWRRFQHAVRCPAHRRAILRYMAISGFLDFIWPITFILVIYRHWWVIKMMDRIKPLLREDRVLSMQDWRDIKRLRAVFRNPHIRRGFELTAPPLGRERLYNLFAELDEPEAVTLPGIES